MISILQSKKYKALVLLAVLIILFLIFQRSVLLIFVNSIDFYLLSCGWTANKIISIFQTGVYIKNHEIVFTIPTEYSQTYQGIIQNWQKIILFKKWTFILLLAIWLIKGSVKMKVKYSFMLGAVHFFAVISGFVVIALLGPVLIQPGSLSQLKPNFIASVLFFLFFAGWFKNNVEAILSTLSRLKIKINLPVKKINEILILIFIFIIIRNFIVPYFNFYNYIHFLLMLTHKLVAAFGYVGVIDGPYIIGYKGTLFMAKWCLGFLTMFIFSSLVYLIGKNKKSTFVYLLAGIAFLHVVNIIRLAMLFIFVQKNPDLEAAYDHHFIYNMVVYVIIFGMWVLFIEKFSGVRLSSKSSVSNS